MSKSFLLRTGFIAAIALGTVASTVSLSFAMNSTGRGGSPSGGGSPAGGGPAGPSASGPSKTSSGPSSPGGGDGNGGESPESRLVRIADCPPGAALTRCGGQPKPPVRKPPVHIQRIVDRPQHCDNFYWRHVMLWDGSVVEDHSRPMRKYCQVLPLD